MQETPDKTGLLLELPKFRKSSKASQDDQESNESFSSGFRSGPESEGKVQLASPAAKNYNSSNVILTSN